MNEKARVLMEDGSPTANLFASGEIMAGNILGNGYLRRVRDGDRHRCSAGIAGQEAASHARN